MKHLKIKSQIWNSMESYELKNKHSYTLKN